MYIDTHCHLDSVLEKLNLKSYSELKEQFPRNFEGAITISCDTKAMEPTLKLTDQSELYGAFGIHPHEAKHYNTDVENQLCKIVQKDKIVAWGEMGLDYFYSHSNREVQKEVFTRQMHRAIQYQKPMIIHTRDAEDDTFEMMTKHIPTNWKIHVHCFTSSNTLCQKLLNHFPNLYIGFTGIITFKNAHALQTTVKQVPLNRILLETDSPYLAPVPHRGKVCHCGYIPLIAEKIASIKEMELSHIFTTIRNNTQEMYGI